MKVQIALKLEYRLLDQYTREQIETIRDEWITAYREIAESDPLKKELCDVLIRRINRAAELFILRQTAAALPEETRRKDNLFQSEEENQEDVKSLDGSFPLGNEGEMELACSFFSIKELALMQAGLAEQIVPEIYESEWGFDRPKTEKNNARKGILADLRGAYGEASGYYTEHCERSRFPDDHVRIRLERINEKLAFTKNAQSLLERAADHKERETSIGVLRRQFYLSGFIHRVAETEEEKAVVRSCEEQMADCYQRVLERIYKRIEAYKKRGVTDFSAVDLWTLTLDEKGNFIKVSIVGVDEYGNPIYSENCTEVDFSDKKIAINRRRAELLPKLKELALSPDEEAIWFADDPDLYELERAARDLKKKGPLCSDNAPTARRDLSGLVGGQLDAAAWQNYAVEMGLAHTNVNYDGILERLLVLLGEFIELYEKAVQGV